MRRLVAVLAVLLTACTTASPATSERAPSPSSVDGDHASHAPAQSASAGPASAEPAATGGHIAYVAGMDPQIYILDLESGESRQLTELRPEHGELDAMGPMRPVLSCGFGPTSLEWAPHGGRLAFTYGGCEGVVYVVDLDGTLTRIGDGRGATWSHDGRFLVFGANVPFCAGVVECGEASEPGALDLRMVDLGAGGEPVPVPLGRATSNGSMPVFAPDDAWLAFSGPPAVEAGDGAPSGGTYLMRTDGSDARHVADGIWPAGWLEDGRLLVIEATTSALYAIDIDSGDSTHLGKSDGPARVSPDGQLIFVSVSDPATGSGGVRLVDLDGNVLAELAGWGGAWAPDGSAVAIAQPDRAAIVVIARDGAALGDYQVGGAGGVGELAWRPGS